MCDCLFSYKFSKNALTFLNRYNKVYIGTICLFITYILGIVPISSHKFEKLKFSIYVVKIHDNLIDAVLYQPIFALIYTFSEILYVFLRLMCSRDFHWLHAVLLITFDSNGSG